MQMQLLLIDIWQESIKKLQGARKTVHVYMDIFSTHIIYRYIYLIHTKTF